MFLKKIIKGNTVKKRYEYYRLCESIRIGDKTRHRILLNLGALPELNEAERKHLANRIEALYRGHDILFAEVPRVIEQLARKYYQQLRNKNKQATDRQSSHRAANKTKQEALPKADIKSIDINSIDHDEVREVGAEWLCLQAIEELKIASLLQQRGWNKETIATALVHIVSRAVYPASEHKTAQWIENSSAIKELVFKQPQNIPAVIQNKQTVIPGKRIVRKTFIFKDQ
jgi:hypothetical protein